MRRPIAFALVVILAFVLGFAAYLGGFSPATDALPASTESAERGQPSPPQPTPSDSNPPVLTYTVVAEYPHDPDAFTQGLVYDNGELLEGTGLRGESTLRRVDLLTGDVIQIAALADQYFGEGIALFNNRIYQLTWQSRVGFVYDPETFDRIDQFEYATEGWGLTHDGERLIMSDGSATITFRDPDTFEPLDSIVVTADGEPVTRLNELEMVAGELFANVWMTDRIAIIDPDTGTVSAWLDLTTLFPEADRPPTADVLNGIAWDPEGDRLFVTGKKWPTLFEIEVVPPRPRRFSSYLPSVWYIPG